jgi:predicted Zn-dependent peptidase
MTDAVANPRIYRAYVMPGLTDAATPLADVAATILAGGESSRLYNDLVRDKRLAVAVSGGVEPFEKISLIQFAIDVAPGVDPAVVDKRVDELFAEFLAKGPTEDEVTRVATRAVAETVRGLEAVGGFGGKAVTLAEGAVYAGDPDFYRTDLKRYAEATPATVLAAARQWLARGDFRLTVVPGKRAPSPSDVRAAKTAAAAPAAPIQRQPRTAPPAPEAIGTVNFPALERTTLANGIKVTLARRTTVPVVRMALAFDAGFAADDPAKPGLQKLMLGMLNEGTARRSSLDIIRESERLGAEIGFGNGFDTTSVSLSALKPNLAASLDLYADIIRHPLFDPAELERVRGQALVGIEQELRDPGSIARRAFVPALFPAGHPYAVPGTGNGTLAGIKAVTPADLVAYHQRWLRPDNAQLFVVGDVTMAELKPLLESALGDWQPARGVARGSKAFPPLAPTPASRIILIDRPGSPQSYVRAGHLLPQTGRDDPFVLNAANDLIGGGLTARLNADLRETKGWSYGVGSRVSEGIEQIYYFTVAPVQTDRTGDSIAAIRADFKALHGSSPIDAAELAKVINSNARALPSAFESSSDVLAAIARNAQLGRPDDYYDKLPARYQALTTADLNRAAAALDAEKFLWVVVGDRKQVEPQLKPLGLPVEVR